MRLKLIVHTPIRQALVGGIPPVQRPFETCLTGLDSSAGQTAPSRDSGSSAGLPGLLEALHRYRDVAAGENDMIGFDSSATPLFIDPFSTHASDPTSASIETLRQAASNLWRAFSIIVDHEDAVAYQQARATMDDASRARLSIWLRSTDIVVAPVVRDKAGPAKRAGLFETLPSIRQRARDLDIFSARELETLTPLDAWPAFPNFIMRTSLFRSFVDGLFRLVSDLMEADPKLIPTRGVSIIEFALGLFLRQLRLSRPLLRIRQVPVLQVKRTRPTADILNTFDAAFYAATYPDVVNAGQDPLSHFINHGYREHREWASCD